MHLRALALLMRQKLGQRLFRADMPRFDILQLFFRLDTGGDGDEAVKAARVITAVLVLGVAIHRDAISSGLHDASRSPGFKS